MRKLAGKCYQLTFQYRISWLATQRDVPSLKTNMTTQVVIFNILLVVGLKAPEDAKAGIPRRPDMLTCRPLLKSTIYARFEMYRLMSRCALPGLNNRIICSE